MNTTRRGFARGATLAETKSRVLTGALAAAWLCLSCAQPVPTMPPQYEATPQPGEYIIGAADVLRVTVWRNPELSADVPVRPDGMISVPLVNEVHAEGRTPTALKQDLTERMAEYIANPEITVVVLQVNSKKAHVLGEVVRSGPVSLETQMRVLDAIAAAGGFGPFANKKRIRILRTSGGQEVEYQFNYAAFLRGKSPESNILLQPGDTIVVPD